jgi:hypothetical protein
MNRRSFLSIFALLPFVRIPLSGDGAGPEIRTVIIGVDAGAADDASISLARLGASWRGVPCTRAQTLFVRTMMDEKFSEIERRYSECLVMQDTATDLIEELTGKRPTWPDGAKPAPEHERSGTA